MANNAFNFKGLYDKVAGLLKNSAIVTPGDYTPNQYDYVAVYKNVPDSAGTADSTIAIKEYVSVTDIGTGGGGGGGGTMSSFEVSGAGGVTLSFNSGAYGEGPFTIENLDVLSISATSVPSGLNWEGPYDSGTTYQLNDVVSNVDPTSLLYSTWLYINATPAAGQALPTAPATYNTYWAQLGTQGPPGATGAQGQPAATATFGFVPKNTNGTSVGILVAGNVGTSGNDIGKVLLVNNSSTTTVADVTIQLNTSGTDTGAAGWPYNSQITVINISAETSAGVRVTAVSGVDLRSADGAQYLRTQYSTCSVVRRSANEYFMFGDLTNIA
jgi:hypothetical protein